MNYALLIVFLETRVVALENSLKGKLRGGETDAYIQTEIDVAKYQIDLIQRLMHDNTPEEVEVFLAPPKRTHDPIPPYTFPLLEKPKVTVATTERFTLLVEITLIPVQLSAPNYPYKIEVDDNVEVRSILTELITCTPEQVQRLIEALRQHIVRA